AERIVALARRYAATRPAMIVLGGSSMHKGRNGWQGARAVGCLPALTGQVGIPGGGLGPRHGAATHGRPLSSSVAGARRPPGASAPTKAPRVPGALAEARPRALLLFGPDMLPSSAAPERVPAGLARLDLLVSHDLFPNDTARRFADVLLP